MDSSPGPDAHRLPSSASPRQPELTRRPSLLPAFEPLSSSPFPRPQSSKRKHSEASPSHPRAELKYYPTPVPTSSTGILPSSPARNGRPGLQRTLSTLSERVPLGAVPSVNLPFNGEPVRMGRSSNSSDYQLSANRAISRVHIQAAYHAPDASDPKGCVEVQCMGWNGAKVHCRGQVYALNKGQSFVSNKPEADIMVDVQDTRVLIIWPSVVERSLSFDSQPDSDSVWIEQSPNRRSTGDHIASSPPVIPRSPASQSPIIQPNFTESSTFLTIDDDILPQTGLIQVYEDDDIAEDHGAAAAAVASLANTPSRPALSRSVSANDTKALQLSNESSEDSSDEDEENDPVVHSFGPFGENLLPRMASMTASSTNTTPTQRRRRPLAASRSPRQPASAEPIRRLNESPIKNHVINQLAFSRLHSIPLSTIFGNLPKELKLSVPSATSTNDTASDASTAPPELAPPELKKILDNIPCVGEISREGKDAAGKPLENEFYYVPEMDSDQMRRDAVVGGIGGSGLRSVRKSHKQYYWKRPRH